MAASPNTGKGPNDLGGSIPGLWFLVIEGFSFRLSGLVFQCNSCLGGSIPLALILCQIKDNIKWVKELNFHY